MRKSSRSDLFWVIGIIAFFSIVALWSDLTWKEEDHSNPYKLDYNPQYDFSFPSLPTVLYVQEPLYAEFIPDATRPSTIPSITTPSHSATNSLTLVSAPGTVERGNRAYVKVKGKPNTRYYITVHYPSGESEAQDLYSKESDVNGFVGWGWLVGGSTSPGIHRIVIRGGGERITVKFRVIK